MLSGTVCENCKEVIETLQNESLQHQSRVAALETELTEQLKKSTQFHALALQANFKLDAAKRQNETKDQEIAKLTAQISPT